MFKNSLFSLNLIVLLFFSLTACENLFEQNNGFHGVKGELFFTAENDLIFTNILMKHSSFKLSLSFTDANEVDKLKEYKFKSNNENILIVQDPNILTGSIKAVGTGKAEIQVIDNNNDVIDYVLLRVANFNKLNLYDGTLVKSSVDARLPDNFSLVIDSETPIILVAENKCGDPLIALNVFSLDAKNNNILTITPDDVGVSYILTAKESGKTNLLISAPEIETINIKIEVIWGAFIDSIKIDAAAASIPSVEFWGRAFASGKEVIGINYSWSSTPRVTLNLSEGSAVVATVAMPKKNEPNDERPALIYANSFGRSQEFDILSLREDQINNARITIPVGENNSTNPTLSSSGCPTTNSSTDMCLAIIFLGTISRINKLKRRLEIYND